MIMPKILEKRIKDYIKEGKRFDGRNLDEYREIVIKKGISNMAEGSASVKFGKTEVYAGVKLDVMEPYSESPDEGTLVTTAELSPMASPDFETGPPRIEAIELGRIIDRGVRESGFIDFKKLCIKEGEKVFCVYLDVYAINDSGNLMDVAALAALVALLDAKLPKYNEETGKIERELTKKSLPLNEDAMAFNITVHKIEDNFIVDPTKEEEEISSCRLSLAFCPNDKLRINSAQKGKESALSLEELDKIFKLCEEKCNEIYPKILKQAK